MRERSCSAFMLLGGLFVTGLLSCIHGPSPSPVMAEPSAQIRGIYVMDLDDRVRVEVDGGGTIPYSMTTTAGSGGITLQLTGAVKGQDVQRVEIGRPPVAEIVPTEVMSPEQACNCSSSSPRRSYRQ